jgi:hypothetical protein
MCVTGCVTHGGRRVVYRNLVGNSDDKILVENSDDKILMGNPDDKKQPCGRVALEVKESKTDCLTLKMKALQAFETSRTIRETTRLHTPEEESPRHTTVAEPVACK